MAAPYVRAKLEALYLEHRAPPPSSSPNPFWGARLVAIYPSVHAATHALLVAYQLGYLLQATDCYSPGLAVVRQRVRRVTAQDAKQRQILNGDDLVARGVRFLADNTRNAVIASVFLYKVRLPVSCKHQSQPPLQLLEWWYTSAEQQLAAQRQLAPPPPPPAPQPHPQGVPLPLDIAACALCGKRRTNPAQLTVSGYVFCYPCLHAQLDARGCCPVTLRVASMRDVRRLYQDQD